MSSSQITFTSYTAVQSAFSPNTRKYEPEKTPYLDTFHAVQFTKKKTTSSKS